MKLPLKTLIVEDSKQQAAVLVRRINEIHSDILSITEKDIAYSFEQAITLLRDNEYELSILDISLDGKNCFELFKEIKISNLGIITYITGFNGHTNAQLGLINPHFFINKPTNKFDIGDFIYDLRIHLSKLKNVEGTPSHYLFKDGRNNNISLHNDQIFYIKSNDVYSTIYFVKNGLPGNVTVRESLKDLNKILPPAIFWRIEKRFIVNNEKVQTYSKSIGGHGDVIFLDLITFDVHNRDRIQYSADYLHNYILNK